MKHKANKDVEKSLYENITLLIRNGNVEDCCWATFEEIPQRLAEGFEIFNDEKREIYERR